jgi:hypothetical protein
MKFLPTENITYKTKLKEDEIIKRLSDNIEPKKTFRGGFFGSGSSKLYEGQINNHTFDINRIINYRNSFLPRINGIIEKSNEGTTIKVKMRLHAFVIIFLCIWGGAVGLGCISVLTQAFGGSELDSVTMIPFGMLIFMYILTMGGFKSESSRSKKDLQTIFETEIFDE